MRAMRVKNAEGLESEDSRVGGPSRLGVGWPLREVVFGLREVMKS